MKNEKGITLIALVITVIIMLILAGVAISTITSDGGLFDKTLKSAEAYENAMDYEAKIYNKLLNDIDGYFDKKVNEEKYAKLSIPYVGTSASTVNINTNISSDDLKEYIIYVNDIEYARTTDLEYTIEDLSPETTYNISVVAVDIDNKTYNTNTKTITTRERVYLYNLGNECTELTGGWTGVGVTDVKSSSGASYAAVAPTITRNEDNIYCRHTNSAMSSGSLSTANKINLTNYRKVVADTSATRGRSYWYRMIATVDNTKYYDNSAMKEILASSASSATLARGIFSADISNITEEMYIAFNYTKSTAAYSTYIDSYIYNVWLEY